MAWSTKNHDVIPAQEFLLPEGTMHPYLWAFLESDGFPFREQQDDYEALREHISESVSRFSGRPVKGQKPTESVSGSRLRTWKQLFEKAGLLTVDDNGKLRVSPFGNAVKSLFRDLSLKIDGANEHLTKWAVTVLARYPLSNPLEAGGQDEASYPEDADIMPFKAIWRAMRELDNRIHWQELNRALMLIHYEKDVASEISRIKSARKDGGADYTGRPEDFLGDKFAVAEDDETRRRVTPWITRAGFGGLLIEPDVEDGWWKLREDRIQLIDETLAETVSIPELVKTDRVEFLKWLSSPVSFAPRAPESDDDKALLETISNTVAQHGDRSIVCLAGIPGTGKSRIARIAAEQIVDGDPYRLLEIQFHEGTGYEDFVEGFVPQKDGQGFKLVDKTLRTICKRAKSDPESKPYILLIEEFTRANVHAVLGELLTYIEHRNRKFRFAISQDEESIPENLIVIATMNPRDRSATQLDDAVKRRLHTIAVPSSEKALSSMLSGALPQSDLDLLLQWFEKWFTALPFGHGIFAGATSTDRLIEIWHGTAVHLLSDSLGMIDDAYREAIEEFPWKKD